LPATIYVFVTKRYLTILAVAVLLITAYILFGRKTSKSNYPEDFVSYQLNTQQQDLQLYWRDDEGQLFNTIGNLQRWLTTKGRRLVFAMNGGMFKQDYSPQGLFIQNGKTISPLATDSGRGNFYLKPNGVFYVTAGRQAVVCTTEQFPDDTTIRYATQSGPMLLIKGKIHPSFNAGSPNVNIRNGVGILPNGHVVFAMSKREINFYDFARYFQDLGCRNALYLDGFVSRTYLPEQQWMQMEGDLGVLIGVTEQP
jgi:uncharacterized protein YigE (DUF2233 family)